LFRVAVLCAFVVALALGDHAARASDEPDASPFARCGNPHPESRSGRAVLKVETRDGADEITRSRARLSWSQSDDELRVRLRMLAPDEVAGSTLLLIEAAGEKPEAYAYLPEVDKVKRVGGRHLRKPLFGTTLTYADLARARGVQAREGEPGHVEAWSEQDLDGRPAWRLETRVGREQIVTWLDRERCVVLRSELIDRKGRLARRIEVSTERAPSTAQAFVPRTLLVTDVLGRSQTLVEVEAIELGVRPEPDLFEPESLSAVASRSDRSGELAANR
jgi:hypothetical protein